MENLLRYPVYRFFNDSNLKKKLNDQVEIMNKEYDSQIKSTSDQFLSTDLIDLTLSYTDCKYVDIMNSYQEIISDADKNNAAVLNVYRFDNKDTLFKKIQKYFNLNFIDISLNIQEKNQSVPKHFDTFRSNLYQPNQNNNDFLKFYRFKYLKFYWIFLEDQQPGQTVLFGNKKVSISWKKGNIFELPWFLYHETKNLSNINRPLLVVRGIKK